MIRYLFKELLDSVFTGLDSNRERAVTRLLSLSLLIYLLIGKAKIKNFFSLRDFTRHQETILCTYLDK